MKRIRWMMIGAAGGAGAAYLMDSTSGPQRRAQLKGKIDELMTNGFARSWGGEAGTDKQDPTRMATIPPPSTRMTPDEERPPQNKPAPQPARSSVDRGEDHKVALTNGPAR